MSYDPTEDPRYLGGEDEVDPQLVEELAMLPKIDDVLQMFALPAWEEVEKVLQARLAEAKALAIGARSMEELSEYRGKIRAFLTLLSLPDSLRAEQIRLLERAAELQETEEGG